MERKKLFILRTVWLCRYVLELYGTTVGMFRCAPYRLRFSNDREHIAKAMYGMGE
jgi:hypothetical protein